MKNEKKAWVILCGFLLLIGLPISLSNILIDCANRFHPIEKNVVSELISGKNVCVVSGNENERRIKMELIKSYPTESIDCIVIGSSLVAYIDQDMVKTSSFVNCAVTNGDYYDMYAQFGLIKELNKKINKAIILIAPGYFFDGGYVSDNILHDEYMNYSEYMINFLNTGYQQNVKKKGFVGDFFTKPLLSISYFQKCLLYLLKNIHNIAGERYQVVDSNYPEMFFYPSGNRSYAKWMKNRTEADVIRDSTKELWEENYQGQISEACCHNFELLIDFLLHNNVEIEFFISPLSPAFYSLYEKDKYPIIEQTKNFIDFLANKYQIKIIGAYNPNDLGIKNEHFYDYVHIKKEYMNMFFEF